jgi:hypothetical protein
MRMSVLAVIENALLCSSAKCRLMNDSSGISMCIFDDFL